MPGLVTFEWREAEEFAREFERLFYARDAAAMASYYTEDAKLMVDEQPTIQGRRAIEEFWQAAYAMAWTMTRTIAVEEVVASGDLGYLVARVTLRVPVAEGRTVVNIVKDVTVWKLETDGWRMAVDISNRDAPPATPLRGR